LQLANGTVYPLIQANSGNVLLSRIIGDAVAASIADDPFCAAMNESKQSAFLKELIVSAFPGYASSGLG
jgi:hypothetical protein